MTHGQAADLAMAVGLNHCPSVPNRQSMSRTVHSPVRTIPTLKTSRMVSTVVASSSVTTHLPWGTLVLTARTQGSVTAAYVARKYMTTHSSFTPTLLISQHGFAAAQ